MGRGTYRPSLDHGITSPYAHLRQYVVGSTPAHDVDPAVTVVDDPLALVRQLKREEGTGSDIRLRGGGRLAGALLPEIDELVLKSYPVVAGTGIPVFDSAFDPPSSTSPSAPPSPTASPSPASPAPGSGRLPDRTRPERCTPAVTKSIGFA